MISSLTDDASVNNYGGGVRNYTFFQNIRCEYFPCHEGDRPINCLFCYCPLYVVDGCPGTPRYVHSSQGVFKDCSDCLFPHRLENYDSVISELNQLLFKKG